MSSASCSLVLKTTSSGIFASNRRARSLAQLSGSRSADLLYNIVSRRHERKSTVITTNLAFKQWNTVFPGAACVGALVDRFAQHCHTMDIDADSWRQKPPSTSVTQPKSPSKKPKT